MFFPFWKGREKKHIFLRVKAGEDIVVTPEGDGATGREPIKLDRTLSQLSAWRCTTPPPQSGAFSFLVLSWLALSTLKKKELYQHIYCRLPPPVHVEISQCFQWFQCLSLKQVSSQSVIWTIGPRVQFMTRRWTIMEQVGEFKPPHCRHTAHSPSQC